MAEAKSRELLKDLQYPYYIGHVGSESANKKGFAKHK